MTMTAPTPTAAPSAARKRAADPIDPKQAVLISRVWNEARQLTLITVRYPARDRDGWYVVSGWSDGKPESCECDGWRFRQSCRHGNEFVHIVAELVEEDYRGYETRDLLDLVAFWQSHDAPLSNDQRLAYGAQRAVLARRNVRVPAAAALVERGRAAIDELFGDGAA